MPCILLILVLAFPRIVLGLLFFLTNYIDRAYHGLLIPLLGFIFLPLTTIVYAWLVNNHRPLDTFNFVFLILSVVIDLGGAGSSWWRRSRY